jgi:hypothetical protein
MKRALVAALASLMLAGILAGTSEPIVNVPATAFFSVNEGSSPGLLNPPFAASYGDSMSR